MMMLETSLVTGAIADLTSHKAWGHRIGRRNIWRQIRKER